jgi:hypothetical protein
MTKYKIIYADLPWKYQDMVVDVKELKSSLEGKEKGK